MRKLFVFIISIFSVQMGFSDCPPSPDPFSLPVIPAPVPPTPNTCPIPGTVPSVANYLPITILNDSTLSSDDIYIAVLVNSKTQYLSFSSSGGHKVATVSNFTASSYLSSSTYSKPLSYFEKTDTTEQYTFYIPNTGVSGDSSSSPMVSSQIIISVGQPMTYFIDSNGLLAIPAINNALDDNYFILNDKVEFDLGSNNLNRLNLNLTGVDFFGLPLLVQANYQFFYGSSYTPNCAVTGWPAGVTFAEVFSGYRTALNSIPSPFTEYWEALIATYTNPSSTVSDLRIYSPKSAMTPPVQTQTNPSLVSFPTSYFLNSISDNASCTWFNAVWSGTTNSGQTAFYRQKATPPHGIEVDATTTNGPATAKAIMGNDGSFTFTVSASQSNPDKGATMVIPSPTNSMAFFTGAVSDYQPPITGSASDGTKAQIFKVFATSIIGSFFPINCYTQPPFVITQDYLESKSANYFQNNTSLESLLSGCACESNIPWFDFYSRTLLTLGTPNLFYTSAYSDELGTDGTIVIVDLNTQNADATILITLNSLAGVTLPTPFVDATTYSITVAYNGQTTAEYSVVSNTGPWLPISNPISATGSAFWVKASYTEPPYDSGSYIVQVSPSAKITSPTLPYAAVITTTGTNCTVALGGPAPPPS